MQEIYEDYDRMGVPIFSYRAGSLQAASLEMGGNYAVFADFFQFPTVSQQKRMLMHELGHCATGCTHKLSSRFDLIERHEFRADKYAALRYLSPVRFCEAFAAGVCQPWELAEWFGVPQDFVSWALQYYTENHMMNPEGEVVSQQGEADE